MHSAVGSVAAALPDFARAARTEISEPDLVLPSGRASPAGGVRIKRRDRSPPPRPKRSSHRSPSRSSRTIERLQRELARTREDLGRTKRIVGRLSMVVDDYQSRYPEHNISKTSLAKRAERREIRAHPEPLLEAYDEQLARGEEDIKKLEAELARVVENAREVVRENEQARNAMEEMKQSLEAAEAENAELRRDQEETEKMMEKGVTADKLSRELASQLNDLRRLSAEQKNTIGALRASNEVLERKVAGVAAEREAATAEVRRIANLRLVLERRVQEAEIEAENCASLAEKWKMWSPALDDYKRCLDEVGMTQLLETGVPPTSGDARGVLFGAVLRLKKEAQDARRRCGVLEHHAKDIERRASLSAHKAQMESEKRIAELESCRAHLKQVLGTAQLAREERDTARREAITSAREASQLTQQMQMIVEKHREEIRELMDKSQAKIKDLQQEYDIDRKRLGMELDELQKSRVDLQCEIGMLIRDKRAVELNIRDAINRVQINRDKFRQSLGIVSSGFRLEDVLSKNASTVK